MKPERRLGGSRHSRRVEEDSVYCVMCINYIIMNSFYPFCRCIKAFKTLNQVIIN